MHARWALRGQSWSWVGLAALIAAMGWEAHEMHAAKLAGEMLPPPHGPLEAPPAHPSLGALMPTLVQAKIHAERELCLGLLYEIDQRTTPPPMHPPTVPPGRLYGQGPGVGAPARGMRSPSWHSDQERMEHDIMEVRDREAGGLLRETSEKGC
jgi:hypothetical protein